MLKRFAAMTDEDIEAKARVAIGRCLLEGVYPTLYQMRQRGAGGAPERIERARETLIAGGLVIPDQIVPRATPRQKVKPTPPRAPKGIEVVELPGKRVEPPDQPERRFSPRRPRARKPSMRSEIREYRRAWQNVRSFEPRNSLGDDGEDIGKEVAG